MQLTKLLPPALTSADTLHRSEWMRNLFGNGRDSLAGKYLRHGIEGILGALILLLLASFWWPQTRPPMSPTTVRPNAPAITPPGNAADAIVAAHLFGQAQSNAAAVARPAASITVDGIVYAGGSTASKVALTINGQTGVYGVGATLPDGEKVTAINAASLTLAANGTNRNLSISKYGGPGSEGPAAYAALLRGTGVNDPGTSSLAEYAGPAPDALVQTSSPLPPASQTIPSSPTGPARRIVQLPAGATPLDQLHSLRAQLIR